MDGALEMKAAAATGIAQSAKTTEFLKAKIQRMADNIRAVRAMQTEQPRTAASDYYRRAALAVLIAPQYASEADMAAATPGDYGIVAPLFDEAAIDG
jgi:hypothetical protein